jgi:hypothetical protein
VDLLYYKCGEDMAWREIFYLWQMYHIQRIDETQFKDLRDKEFKVNFEYEVSKIIFSFQQILMFLRDIYIVHN